MIEKERKLTFWLIFGQLIFELFKFLPIFSFISWSSKSRKSVSLTFSDHKDLGKKEQAIHVLMKESSYIGSQTMNFHSIEMSFWGFSFEDRKKDAIFNSGELLVPKNYHIVIIKLMTSYQSDFLFTWLSQCYLIQTFSSKL